MDVATEMTYAVPAMIFSVLAIILAAIFLKMKLAIPKDQDANKSDDATDGTKISEQPERDAKTADGEQTKTSKDAEPAEIKKGEDVNVKEENEASAAATESRDSGDVKGKAGGDKVVVEEIGAEDGGNLKTDVGKVGESEEQSHPRQEDNATVNREERESEAETGGSVQASPEPVDGDDHDDDDDDDDNEEEYKVNLKYSPGKMRASQYETLMTREEQEQEQRVQREQLTAIFKLLEENKDTFGEMSDVDVEEQLKLYAI